MTAGNDDARSSWHAYRTVMGDALANVSQEELWYVAHQRGAAWNFRTSGRLSPHLADFVQLVDYVMQRQSDNADGKLSEEAELEELPF